MAPFVAQKFYKWRSAWCRNVVSNNGLCTFNCLNFFYTKHMEKIRPMKKIRQQIIVYFPPWYIFYFCITVLVTILNKRHTVHLTGWILLWIDTIPCLLTPWSEWSDCSVTCGKGLRTRQRMFKSPAELGECNEEVEQVEKCMLPECRKLETFSSANLQLKQLIKCTQIVWYLKVIWTFVMKPFFFSLCMSVVCL